MANTIYTIGHSTQSSEKFVAALHRHNITAIADVRSTPFSRFNPQFNRQILQHTLKLNSIYYVFLGQELGARSSDEGCYIDNRVSYDLLAKTDLFQRGISRLIVGSQTHVIAVMCAEQDPLDCHRTILVARELVDRGFTIQHILSNSLLEAHSDTMMRLSRQLSLGDEDFFRTASVIQSEAYAKQGFKIAYKRKCIEEEEIHSIIHSEESWHL